MNYRSHTAAGIKSALADGQPVWELDTGSDGEDDVLIGDYDDVLADICQHHEITELRPEWTLKPVREV